MKTTKIVTALAILAFSVLAVSSAFAVTMTVGSASGPSEESIQIPITVDNPSGIAGAAFTLTYDTSALTVTVDSTFFDTFANQWVGTPNEGTAPTSVTVDSVTYDQPLITNVVTGTGMRIAAARATPGDSSNSTLFTLTVSLNSGAEAKSYPINITSTVLNNTAAGYSADGESIPILVGANLDKNPTDPAAFPILLDPSNHIGSVVGGIVTFGAPPPTDEDNDGISDDWENSYFGNLTTANATSDYDKDGYSDKQEYLNGTDAKTQDPPDGTGYNSSTDFRVAPWTAISGTQYNMVVYGRAYDGDNLAVEDDWIGAFGPGGETDCRGVARVSSDGSYYLTIVGNTNGEVISYKLRRNNLQNATSFEMLEAEESSSFQSDITEEDKDLHFASERTQSVDLIQGWNWVSFNVLPSDTSLEGFFGTHSDDIEQVKTQTRSATNVVGRGWIGDDLALLSNIGNGSMFKIKSKRPFTLEVKGSPIAPEQQINLVEGWSWIAYLPNSCKNVEQALVSVLENLYQVKSQTQSKTKIADSLRGDLEEMCPGRGYTIKMNAASILTYPNP